MKCVRYCRQSLSTRLKFGGGKNVQVNGNGWICVSSDREISMADYFWLTRSSSSSSLNSITQIITKIIICVLVACIQLFVFVFSKLNSAVHLRLVLLWSFHCSFCALKVKKEKNWILVPSNLYYCFSVCDHPSLSGGWDLTSFYVVLSGAVWGLFLSIWCSSCGSDSPVMAAGDRSTWVVSNLDSWMETKQAK